MEERRSNPRRSPNRRSFALGVETAGDCRRALVLQKAQQLPVAKNPQGTSAFAAGLNDGVSSVVVSGPMVMVSPAPLLLVNVLVE